MTNPFGGGTGANADVGTASGKVRIEYESVGATSVVNQVQQVHQAVEKSAAAMDALNRRNKDSLAETLLGANKNTNLSGFGTSNNAISQHISQITRAVEEFKRQGSGFDSLALKFDHTSIREQAIAARRIVQSEFSNRPIDFKINVDSVNRSGGVGGNLLFDVLSGRGTGGMLSAFRSAGVGAGQALGGGIAGGLATAGVGVAIAGLTTIAAGAAAAVAGVGYAITKGFQRQENIDTAATKMRALGYNTQQVQSIMQSALASVDKTAFSLDEAAQTAVQALAAGVRGGDNLTNYLKDVANTAALAKTSMADMGYYFNQVATQGHLEGNQLQELQQRGVPILQYLADEYGVTQQKAAEMVTNGEVDFGRFEQAVHKHVSGIATTMGQSIQGSIENLQTSIKKLGAAFLAPIFGNASGDMSNFAKGVQQVQHIVDGLAKQLVTHGKGLVDFWADAGEAALMGAHIIADAVDLILHIIGDGAKYIGNLTGAFGELADSLGAHGVGQGLKDFANSANNFGDSTNRSGNKIYDFNQKIDQGWDAINRWRNKTKDAVGASQQLGDAFGAVAPKAISVSDALEKLNIKSDNASKQMVGNSAEFKKLLDSMVKANAPKDLIDTVTRLHEEYNSSGRAAAEYSEALDKLGDSSATADDKAKSLLKALQDMHSLPSQDETQNLDDAIRNATSFQSNLVDRLDLTGSALVNMNGTINTTSKNGSELVTRIKTIREAMYAMAASGQGNPAEIWERSNKALTLLLQNFGIVGPQAQQIIDTYLKPEKDFTIIYQAKNQPEVQRDLQQLFTQLEDAKAKGTNQVEFKMHVEEANVAQVKKVLDQLGVHWDQYDTLTKTATVTVPQNTRDKVDQALQGIFAKDPTKVPSALDIKTTQSDIISKIVSTDGSLHIPTVLDIQNQPGKDGVKPGFKTWWEPKPQGGGAKPPAPQAPPQPGNPIDGVPQVGPDGKPLTGSDRFGIQYGLQSRPIYPSGSPLDPKHLTGQALQDHLKAEAEARGKNRTWLEKNLGGMGETPDYGFGWQNPGHAAVRPKDASQLKPEDFDRLLQLDPGKIGDLLNQNPSIKGVLEPRIEEAKKQGKGFTEAFAEGINSNNDEVIRAIIELAGLAGDGLGHSPAKYGPLSGTGWTFYRGQVFSRSWAEGISSQQAAVAGAGTTIASAGVAPLDDQITGFVKDMKALNQLASGFTSLAGQVATIGTGFLSVFNTLSGGRLFPKNYKLDPTVDPRRNPLGTWAPGGAGLPPGTSGFGGGAAAPGPLAAGASKQDIANYIISKALSSGYTREQANAIATQAYGESNFNAGISGGQQGDDEVLGIFQEKSAFARSGGIDPSQRTNAQANIDAYFNHLAAAGGPSAAGDIKSLLASVSGGGPAHPSNVGHWDRAVAGVAPFLQAFTGAAPMPGFGKPNPNRPSVLHDFDQRSSQAASVNAAAILSQMFPQITEIGGARNDSMPFHREGRALDIMIPGDYKSPEGIALGNQIQSFLQTHSKELGLTDTIWQNMYSAVGQPTRPYGSTGSPDDRHLTHVHATFAPGFQPTGMPVGPALSPVIPLPVAPAPSQPPAAPPPSPAPPPTPGANPKAKPGSKNQYLRGPDGDFHWYDESGTEIFGSADEANKHRQPAPPPPAAISPTPDTSIPGSSKPAVPQRPNGPAPEGMTWDYDQGKWVGAPGTPGAPSLGGGATPATPSKPPEGTAHWMPVKGKDGDWFYLKTSDGKDRWIPPGVDISSIEFTSDGLPKAPSDKMWSNSGILIPASGGGSFTAPDRPKDFKPQPLPGAPGKPGPTPPAPEAVPGQPVPSPGPQPDGTPQSPLNVQIPTNQPGQPTGALSDLIARNPSLAPVFGGGATDQRSTVSALQTLDSLIAEQNRIAGSGRPGTFSPDAAAAKELSSQLSSMKSGLQSQSGLMEQPSDLEQAQSFISGASGIASDVFQTMDAALQAVASTQNATDILVRGVSNTKEIGKLIDDFQSYITLAQKGFQTAGDIVSFAGKFTSGGGGFGDMGATEAAGQLLGLVGQALGALNTGIDLAQTGYQLTMKYVGRALTSWLGFPGAQDMNFLLDTETGQLQAYTTANPDQKSTFNTLGRMAHPDRYVDQRVQPTNQFIISTMTGDPNQIMNDTMFAVRSSGIGALGYDVARPAG